MVTLTIYEGDKDYVAPSIHISKENLEKYGVGDTFIETGTYIGETVDHILTTDFKNIHTIELNDQLYKDAVEKYKDEPRVTCWQGDSVDCLKTVVDNLDGPATFWLDAHASGPLQGGKSGGTPVLDELDIIASHPCKEHTIIIDDCRLFGSNEWSYVSRDSAIKKILEINSKYNIYYLDGHIPGDVLWATLK
ncbi:hypothetical protein EB001_24405 [bacterium]|nr:hypothetical protein [bacterium]